MENWEKQQEKDGLPDVCPRCNDSGAYPAANGPDDQDAEYCDCPAGDRIRGAHEHAGPDPAWDLKTEGPCRNECMHCGARWEDPASGCPVCHRSFCD